MNTPRSIKYVAFAVAAVAAISGGAFAITAAAQAQTTASVAGSTNLVGVACPMYIWAGNVDGSFSQFMYHVTAVDPSTQTVRVSSADDCFSYTLSNNKSILVIDENDQPVKDLMTMKLNDSVMVYAKNGTSAYAAKDYNLNISTATTTPIPVTPPIKPSPLPIICPQALEGGATANDMTPISNPCPIMGPIQVGLTFGMRSSAVLTLQQYLQAQGYLAAGANTGYFGAMTLAAVKAFQAAHSVPSTGYVGSLTVNAMNSGSVSNGTIQYGVGQ